MTEPDRRRLSRSAVRKLLAETAHERDDEMSRALGCDVYSLADGSALLVFEHGGGLLHFSRERMIAGYQAAVERALTRQDPFLTSLGLDVDFPSRVPGLIERLPAVLQVDPAQLRRPGPALRVIDKSIRRRRAGTLLAPEVFLPVMAYVGDVICSVTSGRWEMRESKPGRGVEPFIAVPDGRAVALLRLSKEFLEFGSRASVYAFVLVAVGSERARRLLND